MALAPRWRFVICLPLAGCVSPTSTNDQPATLTLSVGQEVVVAPNDITFRLDSITGDSRCAVEVVCVQAGSVISKLTVSTPTHPTPALLVLDSAKPDSSTGVILEVTGVDPVKHQGVSISQGDYRLHLRVTKP